MLTTDLLHELRAKARDVTEPRPEQATARAAARRLAAAVSAVSAAHGLVAMREACAALARGDAANPRIAAVLDRAMALVRVQFGEAATRAALAFWASEVDPAVWRDVVAA